MSDDGSPPATHCDLTVVVPVRNGGALLAEQLEALSRQDFPGDWEVVIADNGSTDGTQDLVRSFQDRLRIRLVDASDRVGPAHARNRGAAAARGEWLAFCDADDVADEAWLRQLYDFRTRGELVAGALDATTLNPPEVLQARGFHQTTNHLPPGPASFLPYAASANVMVQRERFEQLGGWDESLRYCEDVDFCWRAQLAGWTLAYQPAAIVHYRFRREATALFRQVQNYARWEPALYVRYRRHGASRPPASHLPWQLWWLATRIPYPLLGLRRRMLWVAVAAELSGHLKGSWDQRIYYA